MYKIYDGQEIITLLPELHPFAGIDLMQDKPALAKVLYIMSLNSLDNRKFQYHIIAPMNTPHGAKGVLFFVFKAPEIRKATKIELKPLSVNEAFKGKRFKTPAYKLFERNALFMLPKIDIPPPPYEVYFKFGFSSAASDWDNCIKQTQDVIAKKYGFNDKLIRRGIVDTEIVDKGKEYFEFDIKTLSL